MIQSSFPSVDAYVSADPVRLRSLYNSLFARIHEKERTYRVFSSVPPRIPMVLEEVDNLIERCKHSTVLPPLYGVPIGIKGIFRTTGYPIRCGSLLPSDLFEGPEAAIVGALRKLGAIIIGNTATAEFACAEPPATCNPLNTAHTPGGSSSGSAAGVAAGFFPLSVGTQTVGSVIRPAAFCGITGFKPSYGLLPTAGAIYFSRSVDHVGLFTATSSEMETVFHALTPERAKGRMPDVIRLGVPTGPYLDQALPETLAHLDKTLEKLAGARNMPVEIVRIPCFRDIETIAARHKDLIAAEFMQEHAGWFERYQAMYRPRTLEMLNHGKHVGATAIDVGRESQLELREKLHALMRDNGLTAWACPAALGEADKGLGSTGSAVMSMPWSHTGMPALTIPAGRGGQGLPLGLQLVAAFDEDEMLLAAGKALSTALAAK